MVKVFFIALGFGQKYLEELKTDLQRRLCVTEASVQECDVIVALCTIVSRVGTDVEAAFREIPISKPAVLVVLHHTYEVDYVVPNTQRYVRQSNVITVDMLFHEEAGLLYCTRNEDSKKKVTGFLHQYETDTPRSTYIGRSTGFGINAPQCTHNILVLSLLALLVIIIIVLLSFAVFH